jgi:uncharacterized protein (TIGR03437 family)
MKRRLYALLAAGILLPAATWAQIGNIVVTNAASFRVGVPQPDSIGSIFCTGLSVNGVASASAVPLPFTLAGVSVSVGGAPAPLFAVADLGGFQQINFQVPLEAQFTTESQLNPDGTTQVITTTPVVVSQNGAQGSATVATDPTTPGEFFRLGGGASQYGIFQHADYSPVTEQSPAAPGETIIAYLTGLPTATPPEPTGQPASADPLSVVVLCEGPYFYEDYLDLQLANVSILNSNGGCQTPVLGLGYIPYIGLSPGSVGLYQINLLIPSNVLPPAVPHEDLPLTLRWHRCSRFPGGGILCAPSDQRYSQPVMLPVGRKT